MWFEKRAISFEEQLTALAGCGIRPLPTVLPSTLLRTYARDQFESEPYKLLLMVLGEPGLSDDIWHLDTECIDAPGAYAAVAKRMAALAKDALPIDHVTDDISDEEASLSFRLRGREYRWQARVDDDWIDGEILSRFVALLAQQPGNSRRYIYSNFGGQDCLIGCMTAEQRDQLNSLGGPRFVWLS